MNAVEIEEAISDLAIKPFDKEEFPYQFLAAFGNKDITIKRLRTGNNNSSDIPGGVLQRNNIHLAVCDTGDVSETLTALHASTASAKGKVKFILATDGQTLEAKELINDELIVCDFQDFPNHFGFFLPLAGISTIKEIKDNPVDVRATGRLNKLYVELLKENPEWAKEARRADMNHFMARLVFCFFAEDTSIFEGTGLFTRTVDLSERDGSNTHEVLENIFRAMNIRMADRAKAEPRLPSWAAGFPYVNGGLFSGSTETPKFSRMARTYLQHTGGLNWKEINPDIFGSMIQAVADDAERGSLGMHYTSVPNILKVLNPLFLDDLRTQLAEAGDNERKLLNLRKRIAHIRVFDPACGSGNFLVIAYKQMREIEAEINRRRGELNLRSEIPLTNFRGIELRDFPAEIARLALIIAEFQCDVLYLGQQDAVREFLPLQKENWIVCGNALRLDWLSICPPTGTGVKVVSDDLFMTPLDQAEIDFENEGGETYICGNPPYIGQSEMSDSDKDDLRSVFARTNIQWKLLDYVFGWFQKATEMVNDQTTRSAFVATNSVCQGQQVPAFWPTFFDCGKHIAFARVSFKWRNLAKNNAGVTVVVVGISSSSENARLYDEGDLDSQVERKVSFIGPYLVPNTRTVVDKASKPLNGLTAMDYGSKPADGGGLILKPEDYLSIDNVEAKQFVKKYLGSDEYIDGKLRYCLWVEQDKLDKALSIPFIEERIAVVRQFRSKSKKEKTREQADTPYAFAEIRHGKVAKSTIPLIIPIHSSESREFLPVGALEPGTVVSNAAFSLYESPLWSIALIASRLHLVWIATVCGKLETRYRYSNTLGWNTFPVPLLTEQNKADLTRCAEDILLARESHFPATIDDLYDPESMPDNLRQAHERNDEVLERIYIGRRFRNDTERLEKLFELYTKMTTAAKGKPAAKTTRGKKTA